MAEPKFTPGPWRLDRATGGGATTLFYWIASYSDDVAGDFQSIASTGTSGPMEANARLIAAAPDLYAALSAVLGWMDDNPTGIEMLTACNHAKQALAKARGEV